MNDNEVFTTILERMISRANNTTYIKHLNIMVAKQMNIAPVEVCRKFSVESLFTEGSFGCHAIEKYFAPEQVEKIYTQYECQSK